MEKKSNINIVLLWNLAVIMLLSAPLGYFWMMRDIVWVYIMLTVALFGGVLASFRLYLIKENKSMFKKIFFVDMMYILLPNISWMAANYLLYINNIESNITLMFVCIMVAIPIVRLENKVLKEYILDKQKQG